MIATPSPLLADNFRANLQRRFDSGDVTKAEVARKCGINRVTIYKILKGTMQPSLDVCERLAEAIGISPPERIFHKIRKSDE